MSCVREASFLAQGSPVHDAAQGSPVHDAHNLSLQCGKKKLALVLQQYT